MRETLRREYLRALDIPIWLPRDEVEAAAIAAAESIARGPGSGATLFVCASREQSATRLASDIARALAEPPVWAWPDDSDAGASVVETVRASLFTGLVVFGLDLAGRVLGPERPQRLETATVLVADDLDVLSGSAGARRALWRQMCAGGVVTSS